MSTPRVPLPEPFRSQIEAAAFEFAAQVVGAFEQSILDVQTRLRSSSQAVPPAQKRTSGRGYEQRIVDVLRRVGRGMGAEEIRGELGSRAPELTTVLQGMVERKRLVRRGNPSGSRFYLA
jgi:hypothetical protein